MRVRVRLLLAGAVLLALGIWCVTAANTGQAAGDDNKDITTAVQKMADAIGKGDMATAEKEAAALQKNGADLNDVMGVMKLRSKDGMGIGAKAGTVPPNQDGIESMIQGMAKRPPTAADLKKNQADYAEMARRTEAIAEVADAFTPKKKQPGKDPADWKQWAKDMKDSSEELGKAIEANNPMGVKTAASKLNKSCNDCHAAFRD